MPSSVVLLSAGLDSTVNLAIATHESNVLVNITFDYGHKAASKEIESASLISKYYNIEHRVIKLPWLMESQSSLIRKDKDIPKVDADSLDNIDIMSEKAMSVWVANRNGIFVNIAASIAEMLGAEHIVGGFNKEEGATFIDNSSDFVDAANLALKYSTLGPVNLIGYTKTLNKSEVAEKGIKLNVPFDLIWSCYNNNDYMCGQCEPCMRLTRAFKDINNCRKFGIRVRTDEV